MVGSHCGLDCSAAPHLCTDLVSVQSGRLCLPSLLPTSGHSALCFVLPGAGHVCTTNAAGRAGRCHRNLALRFRGPGRRAAGKVAAQELQGNGLVVDFGKQSIQACHSITSLAALQGLPAGGRVQFEVELLGFDREANEHALAGPAKLERAGKLKDQGNVLYKQVRAVALQQWGCVLGIFCGRHAGWESL